MADLLRMLNIAKRALFAHQTAMNTAGQNIANVNTKGYSRQRVTLAASRATPSPFGFLGSGVEVQTIERIRSEMIDRQLLDERPSLERYDFKSSGLGFIEEIFNEPSEFGLSRNIEDFFNSWHDLANNPESTASRAVVRQRAQTMTSSFRRIDREFANYQTHLNHELSNAVDEVNLISKEIAKLNERIVNSEVNGHQAPDLRDHRDLLVEKLSKLVDVRTNENEHGGISVSVGNRTLVVGTSYEPLTLTTISASDPGPFITFEGDSIVAQITNGKIKGLLDLRDENIPDYRSRLDAFAVALTKEINAVHTTGYNLSGITGIDFFDSATTGAADFEISTSILANANLIATSDTTGEPGNNAMALAMAKIADSLTMNSGEFTFSDYYNSLISNLGSETQEANFLTKTFGLTVEQLEFSRESISGVSLDEEITNMIEAQAAFNAAARVISTVDEMTQVVLNMT